MTSGEWVFFWLFIFILSSKKSSWRTVAIIGMLYCLCSCTRKGYSFVEARAVQRHHDHRVAVNKRHGRSTTRKVQAYAEQQAKQRYKEQQQRQRQLSRTDAAAHQRIK